MGKYQRRLLLLAAGVAPVVVVTAVYGATAMAVPEQMECTSDMEVAFAFDSSSSVGSNANWALMLQFATQLAELIEADSDASSSHKYAALKWGSRVFRECPFELSPAENHCVAHSRFCEQHACGVGSVCGGAPAIDTETGAVNAWMYPSSIPASLGYTSQFDGHAFGCDDAGVPIAEAAHYYCGEPDPALLEYHPDGWPDPGMWSNRCSVGGAIYNQMWRGEDALPAKLRSSCSLVFRLLLPEW